MVIMKRSISVLFKSVLFTGVLSGVLLAPHSARAQATHAATERKLSLTAGVQGSAFQPDFTTSDGVGSSPDYLFGVGAFADVRFTRWIQIEVEGRWLHINPDLNFDETNYLAGFRVPIRTYGKITPYVKVLDGVGDASFLTGHASDLTFGGGVDYKLSKKFVLRAGDFEYQRWRTTPKLQPYGFSVGLGYKFF
jgi:opacity protein-like surface antigen